MTPLARRLSFYTATLSRDVATVVPAAGLADLTWPLTGATQGPDRPLDLTAPVSLLSTRIENEWDPPFDLIGECE